MPDHTDLNRRVAIACGWVSEEHNPAREWHDAMIAAERFGLFTVFVVLGQNEFDEWFIGEHEGNRMTEITSADTPAAAISLAIVKLAEENR